MWQNCILRAVKVSSNSGTAENRFNCQSIQHALWRSICEASASFSQKGLDPEYFSPGPKTLSLLARDLSGIHMIDGRLARIHDDSPLFDASLSLKMQKFLDIAGHRILDRLQTQHTQCALRDPVVKSIITFDSLKVASDYLGLTVLQRRLVRKTISQQIFRYDIWCMALETILKELYADLRLFPKPWNNRMQIAVDAAKRCIQLVERTTSVTELPSWTKPVSRKKTTICSRWGEVFDLFEVMSEELRNLAGLVGYVTRIDAMKEGLSHIRDIRLDNNLGLSQLQERQSAVRCLLSQNLGHTSECLFFMLIFYLFQSVRSIKVNILGDLNAQGDKGIQICMGVITASADRECLLKAVKQVDRALRLIKFVCDSAELIKDVNLEGHVWSLGACENTIHYRGVPFHIHAL